MTCWIYLNTDETDRVIIFGNYSANPFINWELTADCKQRVCAGGTSNYTTKLDSTVIAKTTWTHLAFTYDGVNTKFYVNGILKSTSTGANTISSKVGSNRFYLGSDARNDATRLKGKINDFRLYNHCLSDKEVEEISKGLVLHYKLDNQNEIGTGAGNKYSNPYSEGYLSSTTFTRNKLQNERGYHYTYTYTGNGNNSWPQGCVPNFSFTVDKTYYYSCKIRCNKWTAGTLSLRASRCNNDWVTRSVVVCSSSLADGQWHEYYTYQTIPQSFERSGTVTSNPVLEFYCSNLNGNGTLYDFDFDIKDIQVIESNTYQPFSDGTFNTTTIYDSSGYNNDGTIVGNISMLSDTIRNSLSTNFISGSYIRVNKQPAECMPKDAITVSLWSKSSTWSNPISCTEGGGWNFENNSGIAFPIYISGVGYKVATSGITPSTHNGSWHMYTGTMDKDNVKIYIDGELKSTVAVGSTNGIGYANNYIFINGEASGNQLTPASSSRVGLISDVRIYATALTESQIKELYNTSASIDNKGNIFARELVE